MDKVNKKKVLLNIDEPLLRVADFYSRSMYMSRSEMVRTAVEKYLRAQGVDIEAVAQMTEKLEATASV